MGINSFTFAPELLSAATSANITSNKGTKAS